MKYADLTRAQQLALIDIVSRGGLFRIAAGYDGSIVHSHGTMLALARRGLCRIHRSIGDMGAANPSRLGRKIIIDEFGGTAALVDAKRKRGK
ncbi:hypothetical protein AAFX91_21725 [Bradyrhizobium sp. 31Argb]|uniref:hypothetical protein n=1 Tax=Bradyrhizobium sp. 31Argb TaxID=3141247 RepID=UPI00374878AA